MNITSISKLKAHLSEYILKIKSGDEILISDRGKPVAKIVPLKRDDTQIPKHLLDLEQAGYVKIGTGTLPEDFFDMPRPEDKKGDVLKSLLRERDENL